MGWTFYDSSGRRLSTVVQDVSNGGNAGALVLGTNDSNSLTLETNNTPRMVLAAAGDVTVSTGNLVIGTAGKGIDFSINTHSAVSGVSMTSEVLDWYEEGTWTATIQGSTGEVGSAAMNAAQGAVYTRIGRMVTCYFSSRLSTLGSWTGGMRIYGLPFTNAGIGAAGSVGQIQLNTVDAAVRSCVVPASAIHIQIKSGTYLDGDANLSELHTSFNNQIQVSYFV